MIRCPAFFFLFLIIFLSGCKKKSSSLPEVQNFQNQPEDDEQFSGDPLFHLLKPSDCGVKFINQFKETSQLNFYNFQYMYNGGGVAIGDLNNDDLPDIYFTGNLVNDRLYLNKGDLHFEDITLKAGIGNQSGWKNGVCMSDFNHDGWLDIYVCRGGNSKNPMDRTNYLYINNHDLTFTESATQFGLADAGASVQSVCLDYDHDGDLDLYVANHPDFFNGMLTQRLQMMRNPDYLVSDHFYQNNADGTFTDVTLQSGIREFGHGLGPIIIDANQDGWDDIFVANDFQTPDYLWINNHDGTFTDRLKDFFPHCSFYSMGTDVADLNFDGFMDLIAVDMLPENYQREVLNLMEMNENRKQIYADSGLHQQVMRNTLYLNNGNNSFSDIAQYAGVDATDWSWTPLFADFDLDGINDLLVTNGYLHDTQNRDWIAFADSAVKKNNWKSLPQDFYEEHCPSVKLWNYGYRGMKDLKFENYSQRWGFSQPTFSSGAAWGDLDADGDLDLVINNLMDTSFVYQNTAAEKKSGNFIELKFSGPEQNHFGLGTHVTIYTVEKNQFQVLYPTRGFQSSSEPILHFGLGDKNLIDKIEITWSDGMQQVITEVESNQILTINHKDARQPFFDLYPKPDHPPYFTQVSNSGIDFNHTEEKFNDYAEFLFYPQKFSRNGPCIAVADVNGDGLKDFFVGGTSLHRGMIFLQKSNGKFYRSGFVSWSSDQISYEDTDAIFFDVDGDRDADLFVASGSDIVRSDYQQLQSKIYLNDGNGNFSFAEITLPAISGFISCVDTTDFDRDGDLDLFLGGRMIPDEYGTAPRSFLLQNNVGEFSDLTESIAPELVSPGMISDAVWTDVDMDGDNDLLVVGEWMNISLFKNENGKFIKWDILAFEKTSGFWNTIVAHDFDQDGDEDFVAGNIGTNYRYSVASEMPLRLYLIDYFKNGIPEPYFARLIDGKFYPLRNEQILENAFQNFIKRYKNYQNYSMLTTEELFGKAEKILEAWMMESVYIRNDRDGNFTITSLPYQAQLSSVNSILVLDGNKDGNSDLLIAGNTFDSPWDIGDADAGTGLLILGNGAGEFQTLSVNESGFFAPGMVRSLKIIPIGKGGNDIYVLVGNNNDKMQVFRLNQ